MFHAVCFLTLKYKKDIPMLYAICHFFSTSHTKQNKTEREREREGAEERARRIFTKV